ncbi:transporter substrate-binding domain-containing protein [uncultured Desulfosarcina sp.]|uniref:substrate-binding periplasmic protein n=1 Tax=uncultured Desulfosarcina sp. TaxID=218289 RepID=UPI0029C64FD7|nr:transporter substrate-binding domain-containing protein [uncultured Desulfosarcina sp.]
MLKLVLHILILLLLVMNGPAWSQDGKTLILAVSDAATEVVQAYHQFCRQAYHEIGYDVELKEYPIKRSLVQADLEQIDGILISTDSILQKYNNLQVIPVELARVELVVYSITKDFVVDGPSSLKPYRIGLMRGYLQSHALTEGMARQTVDGYNSLFGLLKIGRVDVVIALRRETERFLAANPKFGDVEALSPPLFSAPMYHFLNKRHQDLIPKIVPIMQRLIEDKVLERLYEPYRTD